MLAGHQPSVDKILLHRLANLVQPNDLTRCRVPVPQLDIGGTVPQGERRGERRRRPLGLTRGDQIAAPSAEALEAPSVDFLRTKYEPIARRRCLHRPGPDRPTHADHTRLHLLRPCRRRTVRPDGISQLARGGDLPVAQRQHRQDHTLARTQTRISVDKHRTEHRHTHVAHHHEPQRRRQLGPYRTHTGEHPGSYRIRHTPDCRSA